MTPPSPRPGRLLQLEKYTPGLEPGVAVQDSFEDLGTPLREATFLVVDIETTGGSPTRDRITEIGAVKVRGGEVLGEFSTLINPGVPIPPRITALTGITPAMVHQAPHLSEVFPSFAAFANGCVIVAHNARFDMGFLRNAAQGLGTKWRPVEVVDTLALARKAVTKDEVPNHRLSSLSRLFHSPTEPTHRALDDARATVAVLHGLLERLGPLGVTHVEDLKTATDPIPASRRRRSSLASDLPSSAGVYLFHGPNDEVLYVGTTKNLRRRVRQYFTTAPDRARIGEMVDLASRVSVIECPTNLEAQIRELRMITQHAPIYNQRSTRAHRLPWLRLTREPLPRIAVVHSLSMVDLGIGPFASRKQADAAHNALQELGIRACTTRLPLEVSPQARSCVLHDLGQCSAPCIKQPSADRYHRLVTEVETAFYSDFRPAYSRLSHLMKRLSLNQRYEAAAQRRDNLYALMQGISRWQRLSPWWRSPLTVAARWEATTKRWEVVVVKYGRLSASGACPPARNPLSFADELLATSAHVSPPSRYAQIASAEETMLIARWVEAAGTRLITHNGPPLASPIHGAARYLFSFEHTPEGLDLN